jgi:hypothetical protein
MTTKTKKTASKNIDPMEAIKQAEAKLNISRLNKLNSLVKAKEDHDAAVAKAVEDEFADFNAQLEDFSKRVPFLSQVADKLSKLSTLPEVKFKTSQYEFAFSAYRYIRREADNTLKSVFGIGVMHQSGSTMYYSMFSPEGVWLKYPDLKEEHYRSTEDIYRKPTRDGYHANVIQFMRAALDWEKQLLAIVDSL